MRRYDSATDAFGPTVVPPEYSGPAIALDATGSISSLGLSLYDGNFNYLRRGESPLNRWAHTSTLSPSGADLYHVWQDVGILHTRTSDGGTLGRIRAAGLIDHLRVTSDGRKLIAIDGQGAQQSTVTVFDLP